MCVVCIQSILYFIRSINRWTSFCASSLLLDAPLRSSFPTSSTSHKVASHFSVAARSLVWRSMYSCSSVDHSWPAVHQMVMQ